MRGIARYVTPEAITRRVSRLRPTRPEIEAAKQHTKAGQYREALVLLAQVGEAEQGHVDGYDRWLKEREEYNRFLAGQSLPPVEELV